MTTTAKKGRILVVDDAVETLEVLQRNLRSRGYQVSTASNVVEAIELLARSPMDLVITDLKMPGATGMDLVRHVREGYDATEVMVITGYPSIDGAVRAVKTGAEEYLAKPFTDEELFAAVGRAMAKLYARRASGAQAGDPVRSLPGLLGESEAMRRVFSAVSRAALGTSPVLLTGEGGTGKEIVARAIHYRSDRVAGLFVPVRCGDIPESLLDGEIFGQVRGAHAWAGETRGGFTQAAEHGTLFLDEIGEASLAVQARLLRMLREGEAGMVGSRRTQKVDVRIIAGTSVDLSVPARRQAFQPELLAALAEQTIEMPPLRQRGEDLLALAHHFVTRYAAEMGRTTPWFSDEALEVLRAYAWPGNVRELAQVVRRLVGKTEGERIDAEDLAGLVPLAAPTSARLHRPLVEVEAEHIREVVASVDGNKTRAAEILGIDRKTLREKLKH